MSGPGPTQQEFGQLYVSDTWFRYGSQMDAQKTYVYLHTQNPTNHSRSHSLHDWGPGNLYDHPLNKHGNLHF